MLISQKYYYYQSSSQASFSATPTGQIDITRLLQGENDFWIKQEGLIKKKKNLVVTDWRQRNLGDDFLIKKALKTLIEMGFNVYIWTPHQHLELLHPHFDHLPPIAYGSLNEIKLEFKQTSPEHILILDIFEIDALIEGNPHKIMSIDEFLEIKDLLHRAEIMHALTQNNYTLMTPGCSANPSLMHQYVISPRNELIAINQGMNQNLETSPIKPQDYPLTSSIKHAILVGKNIPNLRQACPQLSTIVLNESIVNADDTQKLPTLKKLIFSAFKREIFLSLPSILEKTPLLENLDLILLELTNYIDDISLQLPLLSNLTHLEIMTCKITPEIAPLLERLFNLNPQVQKLKLRVVEHQNDDIADIVSSVISRCNLSNLRNFELTTFDNLNISLVNIDLALSLLKKSPFLKNLALNEIERTHIPCFITDLSSSLAPIEDLGVSLGVFKYQDVLEILKKFQNLHRLSLSGVADFDRRHEQSIFSSLKHLKIDTIDIGLLYCILQTLPHLETLEIDLLIPDLFSHGDIELPHLKVFKVYSWQASEESMQVIEFINQQPALVSLTLGIESHDSLEYVLKIEPKILKRLKVLNLCGDERHMQKIRQSKVKNATSQNTTLSLQTLSPAIIETLLLNCPEIKVLHLDLLLKGPLTFEKVQFKHLSDFFIYHQPGYILDENLYEAAPKLAPECVIEIKKHACSEAVTNTISHAPCQYLEINSQEGFVQPTTPLMWDRSQTHIIRKLSIFLAENNKTPSETLSKMATGICNALTHLFTSEPTQIFYNRLDRIYRWNEQQNKLTPELCDDFYKILEFYNIYQANYQFMREHNQYVGDALAQFLDAQLVEGQKVVLFNPWHVISLEKSTMNRWHLYDPNDGQGILYADNIHLLIALIYGRIGRIIGTEYKGQLTLKETIKDFDIFIAEGGLLMLEQVNLTPEMIKFNDYVLYHAHQIKPESLIGILLRTLGFNVPAWLVCLLKDELKALGFQLLHAYIKVTANAKIDLLKSLDVTFKSLEQEAKLALLEDIITHNQVPCLKHLFSQPFYEPIEPSKSLIEFSAALNISHEALLFENELISQCASRFNMGMAAKYKGLTSQDDFLRHIFSKDKILVHLENAELTKGLSFFLTHFAKHHHIPTFYVDKPSDLACSMVLIERLENNKGIKRKGPSSPLYQFITSHAKASQIHLLINYDHFKPEDRVRYNHILDKPSKLPGLNFDINLNIIGLINQNNPNQYLGADFYSRFDTVIDNQIPAHILLDAIPNLNLNAELSHPLTLNLFQSPYWKSHLLGQWVIEARELKYQAGLISTETFPSELMIENGLWDNEEFKSFWQRAISDGVIIHQNCLFKVPRDIKIKAQSGYLWPQLLLQISLTPGKETYLLNPALIHEFFSHTKILDGEISHRHGHIEKHSHQIINIWVTNSIDEHLWAKLLMECERFNVKINIQCCASVALPTFFQEIKIQETQIHNDAVCLIHSSDIDASLAQHFSDSLVIDVSEMEISDLWTQYSITQIEDDLIGIKIKDEPSVLKQHMRQEKNIVLKGFFSKALQDELAPIILQWPIKPKLILLPQQNEAFSYLSHETLIKISQEQKQQLVADPETYKIDWDKPFVNIQSSMKAQALGLGDPWQGIYALETPNLAPTINFKSSYEEALAFTGQRIESLLYRLKNYPFVFITGLSGVGKTKFMHDHISTYAQIFYGQCSAQSFADNKDDTLKILFIDEANLYHQNWSEFEGLYQNPPHLIIKGKYCQLTSYHKVVFAGNPINYGDERRLASLFERHGNAFVFEPLPMACLYENILKPLVVNSILFERQDVIEYSLNIYQTLLHYAKDELLISPRELQMIYVLSLSYLETYPLDNPLSVVQYFSYLITEPLVPERFKERFNAQFKQGAIEHVNQPPKDYVLTNTQTPMYQTLSHFINVNRFRKSKESACALAFAGLGGLIIEGEPGLGKSDLVFKTLHLLGYVLRSPFEDTPPKSKDYYYTLPVSMSHEDKIGILMRAFDEGAIVVIDEINTAPLLEKLLNDLLMGKKPPQGQAPLQPGFMLIGTQNPVSMGARRTLSTALSRRLLTLKIEPYNAQELENILTTKGLKHADAFFLTQGYLKARAHATQEHLEPKPSVRDLLKEADKEIQEYQNQQALMMFYSNPTRPVTPENPFAEIKLMAD